MEGLGGKMGSRDRSIVLVQHEPDVLRRGARYVAPTCMPALSVEGKRRLTSPVAARYSQEPPQFSETDLPTVDAVVEEKRRQLDARLKAKEQEQAQAARAEPSPPNPSGDKNDTTAAVAAPGADGAKTSEQLEEEAGNEGAFNPETGEINWDCPCLGGMAHGPCGEEFKSAFSCFVYSNEEPKGMDCIDKFQYVPELGRCHGGN